MRSIVWMDRRSEQRRAVCRFLPLTDDAESQLHITREQEMLPS
jgi:hypothetical protein